MLRKICQEGSAGVLFIDPHGQRRAYVVHIRPEIFDVWSHHEAKIAQLELLTVYIGTGLQCFIYQRNAWHMVCRQYSGPYVPHSETKQQ